MATVRWCEICKQPIGVERADNDAKTRLCQMHAEEIAKHGGEFITTASQERTSKEGSLKKNYGAVSTTSVRNQPAMERLRDDYLEQQSH